MANDQKLLLLYPFIDEFTLINETIVHIPVDTSVLKIPASYWNILFVRKENEEKQTFGRA